MNARVGPSGLARLRTELSERDRQILHSVASHRFLSGGQIERLHFHEHASAGTAGRICRRVLQRLVEQRVLDRLERRTVGGLHAGSASHIYLTGPAGRRLLGDVVRTARPPTPSFLEHTLAIADVRIALSDAAREGRFELVSISVEPACWRTYVGAGGARERVRPDLHVISARGEFEYSWFLEVDMGSEGPSALGSKCRTYQRYYQTGAEQARHGVFPRVLWIAPHQRRRRQIERVIASGRNPARELFQVTTNDQLIDLFSGGSG